jgi:hypothetical protein
MLARDCRDVMEYARVGPPVMFVVQGMNISSQSPDIDAVSGCATCNTDSLVNAIAQAAQNPESSHIASPAASWIDDFLAWIQPELPNCCRLHMNGAHEGTQVLYSSFTLLIAAAPCRRVPLVVQVPMHAVDRRASRTGCAYRCILSSTGSSAVQPLA